MVTFKNRFLLTAAFAVSCFFSVDVYGAAKTDSKRDAKRVVIDLTQDEKPEIIDLTQDDAVNQNEKSRVCINQENYQEYDKALGSYWYGEKGKEEEYQLKNFYLILGVNSDATFDKVKKASKDLMIRWHPDKNNDNRVVAEEIFKLVNQARDVLLNEAHRKMYDTELKKIQKIEKKQQGEFKQAAQETDEKVKSDKKGLLLSLLKKMFLECKKMFLSYFKKLFV